MRRGLAAAVFATVAVACSGAQQLKPRPLPGVPQQTGQQNRPGQPAAVQFLSPAQAAIAARTGGTVDLHFRVADGLHINAHDPHERNLIPARLAVDEEGGVTVTAVDFPPGTDYSFAFSPKEKVSVYSGEFVLRAHARAPAGEHAMQGVLRYQACDVRSCLPPSSIPFSVTVVSR